MKTLGKQIAFLCTGDEIVNGEILDTNAPYFSQCLIDHHFVPGKRLIVSDDQKAMKSAILYLLKDHAVLITLGGLGPTSDDRTRFAISEALSEPLEFDQACWERINTLLKRLKVEVPENNRQQCLFPANTDIYPNQNGTASACCITKKEQLIFMLPGPPNECRPIFDEYVLPRLLKTDLQKTIYRHSWTLLGVSEGRIAKDLDTLIENSGCDIGYRVHYPYLEVKLQSTNKTAYQALIPQVEAQIQDRLISRDKRIASEIFYEYLQTTQETFSILDNATQGRLSATLLWPDVYSRLRFINQESSDSDTSNASVASASTDIYTDTHTYTHRDIQITLEGLSEYWQNKTVNTSEMTITIKKNDSKKSTEMIPVPLRGTRTPTYAVELACEYFLKYFLWR